LLLDFNLCIILSECSPNVTDSTVVIVDDIGDATGDTTGDDIGDAIITFG
tara:strand:+ start:255 stop:404 length:150 start_codon:yes stop_codon:yes gene_type:complete